MITLDSFSKLAQQVFPAVSLVPILWEGQKFEPTKSFTISETFFREWHCPPRCGACCRACTLDYTPTQWEKSLQSQPNIEPYRTNRTVNFGTGPKSVVTIINDRPQVINGREYCRFVIPRDGFCSIHRGHPWLCRLELVKFRVVKDRGYLLKTHFGRKWLMTSIVEGEEGIKCAFTEFSLNQLVQSDLPMLKELERMMSYFEIPNVLHQVIETLGKMVHEREFSTFRIEKDLIKF